MACIERDPVLHRLRAAALVVLVALFGSGGFSAAAATTKQKTFATPEQAVDSLLAAARASDTSELLKILGPASKNLISSGDPVADAQARGKFIAAYDDGHQIEKDSDSRALLAVGKDDWPFPLPIVKHGDSWRFDAAAGAEEILERRIGANELDTIEVCRAYVDAQRDYAEQDRNNDGFIEYAQKFLSDPGKHDGLYWPTESGADESPMGPLVAGVHAEGYRFEGKRRTPYHGYFYRILQGQGAAARDGAYDYVLNGHMIAGFALVAFPARYGVSGVMTFIVNHDGVVYQKDLGPQTGEIAKKMTLFDPDPTWKAL